MFIIPQMVPFSSLTLDRGNFSWRLSTLAFGLDKNVLVNWPNGKLLKKLPPSSVLFLLRSSRNRSLSLGRECWVCKWCWRKRVFVHSSSRSPWGPFTWLPKYCHQGQRVATPFSSLYENGEIWWSDSGMYMLDLTSQFTFIDSSTRGLRNHRWSCSVFTVSAIYI